MDRDGWGFSREALKEVREDAGLTTDDVAGRVGMSTHRYRELERGYMDPTDDQIADLARVLEVDRWVLVWQ
jgi:transcriptional regulator with XRE-family HTH domain